MSSSSASGSSLTSSSWNLYIFQDAGLDPDPEYMGTYPNIDEAIEAVKKDFQVAHETCPDDCVDVSTVPTNVEYDCKYINDEVGAFFKIPEDIHRRNLIHIAAIYATSRVNYYARRDGTDSDDDENGVIIEKKGDDEE